MGKNGKRKRTVAVERDAANKTPLAKQVHFRPTIANDKRGIYPAVNELSYTKQMRDAVRRGGAEIEKRERKRECGKRPFNCALRTFHCVLRTVTARLLPTPATPRP